MPCMYTMYCMYTIMCICTIYIYPSVGPSVHVCVLWVYTMYVCRVCIYVCVLYIFTMHTKYIYTTKFDHPSIYLTARPMSCLLSRLFICVSTCTLWIYYICILCIYHVSYAVFMLLMYMVFVQYEWCVYYCIHLSVQLSVCPSMHVYSVCMQFKYTVYASRYYTVHVYYAWYLCSKCPSVLTSVHLPICLSVRLSVYACVLCVYILYAYYLWM